MNGGTISLLNWMARRSKTSLLPGYQRPAFTASVGVREAQRGAGPTPLATDRTSIVGRKPAFEMIRGQEAPQPAALFR